MYILIALIPCKMLQVGAICGVMRFYNLLRAGISWKGSEAIELWCQHDKRNAISDSDDADDKDTALLTYDSTSEPDVTRGASD
jgi:hypothetical protein